MFDECVEILNFDRNRHSERDRTARFAQKCTRIHTPTQLRHARRTPPTLPTSAAQTQMFCARRTPRQPRFGRHSCVTSKAEAVWFTTLNIQFRDRGFIARMSWTAPVRDRCATRASHEEKPMRQRVFMGLLKIIFITCAASCAPEGQAPSKPGKSVSPTTAAGRGQTTIGAAGTSAGAATSGTGAAGTTASGATTGAFASGASGTGAGAAGQAAGASANAVAGAGGRTSRRRD